MSLGDGLMQWSVCVCACVCGCVSVCVNVYTIAWELRISDDYTWLYSRLTVTVYRTRPSTIVDYVSRMEWPLAIGGLSAYHKQAILTPLESQIFRNMIAIKKLARSGKRINIWMGYFRGEDVYKGKRRTRPAAYLSTNLALQLPKNLFYGISYSLIFRG